jgi:ABC-type antimicrobial peptide transport system permease subunit
VALLISLPLGILAALKRHSFVDTICTLLAVAGQAMPIFWLGIMLIIIFAVRLRLLPASGYGTWQNFVMPAFCLGAFLAPLTMRLVRSGLIEVMSMEFIKTARAKGVAEWMVVVKHVSQCLHPRDHRARPPVRPASAAPSSRRRFAWPGVAPSPWTPYATRTSPWSSARWSSSPSSS